jgi:hypothetical protein
LGILLSYWSCELAAVNKLKMPSLRRHGIGNLLHPVSDKVNRGGAGKIQIALAAIIPQIHALSAHGWRKCFAKGASQKCGGKWDGIIHVSDYRAGRVTLSKFHCVEGNNREISAP